MKSDIAFSNLIAHRNDDQASITSRKVKRWKGL